MVTGFDPGAGFVAQPAQPVPPHRRRPRDAAMQALVDDLSAQSPLFTSLWREQTVLHREGGERGFCNARGGIALYQQSTLLLASQLECKLVCLAPMG